MRGGNHYPCFAGDATSTSLWLVSGIPASNAPAKQG